MSEGRAAIRRLTLAFVFFGATLGAGCGTGLPDGVRAARAPAAAFDAHIESPGLGRPATPVELAARDWLVAPDGTEMPPGAGTAAAGESVYVARCLRCHGLGGEGRPADRLVGGRGTLTEPRAVKTVGSYWPFATTLFDYVRRAMPYDRPGSLTNDEVYAVVAYLLAENEILDAATELNPRTLPRVVMPNAAGFIEWESPGHRGR